VANHKSALKRARQNEERRVRKLSTKTKVKNATKMIRDPENEVSGDKLSRNLNAAKSVIDKAAKAGVIHQKTASRKISRLSRLVNTQSA
jgi:small subunit ribosomal protein S20